MANETFTLELIRHPKSGRALYGKIRALQGLGRPQTEIDEVKERFCKAWWDADYRMTENELWPPKFGDQGVAKDQVVCKK